MYILITTIDFDVSYGVDTGLYMCRKIFSSLEDAKQAAEEYLSTIKNGQWAREDWIGTNGHHWFRGARGQCSDSWSEENDAEIVMSIYKLESSEEARKVFICMGGASYFE